MYISRKIQLIKMNLRLQINELLTNVIYFFEKYISMFIIEY